MQDKIKKIIEESRAVKASLLSKDYLPLIEKTARAISGALALGGKVIIFGNGGSASDSQHMAAELVGRFKKERRALPAIALSTNTSTITALSNDYGYDISFKRQLEAFGKKNDIAIGISTSGTAKNVIAALSKAKDMGLATVALTGKTGGGLKDIADLSIVIKSPDTARIQEAHILIIHILCELVEDGL
jgi:D-sedoheptulose 7-phosphate isomerase